MPPLNKMKHQLLRAHLEKARKKKNHNLISPLLSDKIIKIKQELINKINNLPEKQVFAYFKLLDIIIYPDGTHKGEILSPYLQKKARDLILLT